VAEERLVTNERDAGVFLVHVRDALGLVADHDDRLEIGQVVELLVETIETFLVDEEHRGARIGETVGEFFAGPPGVERYDHGTGGHGTPEGADPFGQVP